MIIFIVAQLRFKDRDRYERYQTRFAGVFSKFRGRLLAADEHPRILEGQGAPDKVVVLEFPDEGVPGNLDRSEGRVNSRTRRSLEDFHESSGTPPRKRFAVVLPINPGAAMNDMRQRREVASRVRQASG